MVKAPSSLVIKSVPAAAKKGVKLSAAKRYAIVKKARSAAKFVVVKNISVKDTATGSGRVKFATSTASKKRA